MNFYKYFFLIFFSFISFGQNNFIGSVERLSVEVDKFIENDSKIEIIAKGFGWSRNIIFKLHSTNFQFHFTNFLNY